MAETLVAQTAEFVGGENIEMGLHKDGSTLYHYTPVDMRAAELGGCSILRFANAATNNAQVVKASAGQLYGYTVSGISPEVNYLKFYNLAVAPTVGTSTIALAVTIPKAATATDGSYVNAWFPQGLVFSTGIAIALIESIADTGTAAMDTADELLVNIYYK